MMSDREMETMSDATNEALSRLRIAPEKKGRRRGGPKAILVIVAVVLLGTVAVFMAARRGDRSSVAGKRLLGAALSAGAAGAGTMASATASLPTAIPKPGEPVSTVSGYVSPRERPAI